MKKKIDESNFLRWMYYQCMSQGDSFTIALLAYISGVLLPED
jgi:hypothetical protein